LGKINYSIEIEVFKGSKCDHHRLGDRFQYPDDINKICPWLLDSISAMIRVLQFGGTLPWKYQGTEFEKHLDEDGMSTEFVRCPDPTESGIVVKITRKKLNIPKKVGWS
jgi:uncharacterized repeat protein (TIGR04076 family)